MHCTVHTVLKKINLIVYVNIAYIKYVCATPLLSYLFLFTHLVFIPSKSPILGFNVSDSSALAKALAKFSKLSRFSISVTAACKSVKLSCGECFFVTSIVDVIEPESIFCSLAPPPPPSSRYFGYCLHSHVIASAVRYSKPKRKREIERKTKGKKRKQKKIG